MDGFPLTKFDVLNGSNYPLWSMRMEALLDAKQLFEDVITNDEPNKNDDARWKAWSRKNKETLSLIILTLSPELAVVMMGVKSAKEMWLSLKTRFEGTIEDRSTDLLLELTTLKTKPDESIDAFITRAQGISRQINLLGRATSERELVRYIINGLPSHFDQISAALKLNRGITIVELLQTLREIENEIKIKKPDVKAYKTHEKQFNNNRTKCYHCGKIGHVAKNCYQRNSNSSKQMTNQHNSNFSRNKHRNWSKHSENAKTACEEPNHKEHAFTSSEFSCYTNSNYVEWFLDSGCSTHMISQNYGLEDIESIDREINVAEEGRVIHAKSKGVLRVEAETMEGNVNLLKLSNVLLVPQLRSNLMSVPEIVKHGNEVIFNKNGAQLFNACGELVAEGDLHNNMFKVKMKLRQSENHSTNEENCFLSNDKNLWHRRFAHVNSSFLEKLW